MLDAIAARNAGGETYISLDRTTFQDFSKSSASTTQPRLQVATPLVTPSSESLISPTRRQRRRIGADDLAFLPNGVYASQSPSSVRMGRTPTTTVPESAIRSLSPLSEYNWAGGATQMEAETGQQQTYSPLESLTSDSEEDIAGAAGQLSLNEEEQVRYHGKASGLHLLGDKDRIDSRNEGGIW
jgi:hypothetical protein